MEQEEEKQTAFYLPDDVVTNKKPFESIAESNFN